MAVFFNQNAINTGFCYINQIISAIGEFNDYETVRSQSNGTVSFLEYYRI